MRIHLNLSGQPERPYAEGYLSDGTNGALGGIGVSIEPPSNCML